MRLLSQSPGVILYEWFGGLEFHDTLNPDLWEIHHRATDGLPVLKADVRARLLSDAKTFISKLADPQIRILDIILTGSNAAYNYTPLSDIDVHIITDFSKLDYARVASEYFADKKKIWETKYNIMVKGHPVEFYVQDVNDPLVANGEYSLVTNRWIKLPGRIPPPEDDRALKAKVESLKARISKAIHSKDIAKIHALQVRLKKMRMSGLQHGGEYSVENLAYKILRNDKDIGKLKAARMRVLDRRLSLR